MDRRRGAYGFRVLGLEAHDGLLVPAEASWPALRVGWVDTGPRPAEAVADDAAATATVRFTADGAVIALAAAGVIELERDPPTATIRAHALGAGHAIVHPYLGGAASVLARWHDREALHGGGVVAGGGAWGILGPREAGKSSMLAWLHLAGCSIVADDVLVLERGEVFAGPRTLDLREETALRLGLGDSLGTVGARERWRVVLHDAPSSVRLQGWIFLEWGERLELVPLRGHERLARLAEQLTLPAAPADAASLLELAALPSLAFRRPRDWGGIDAAGRALLDRIGG